MQRPKPLVLAVIAAAVLLLILVIVLLTRGNGTNEDRLSDEEEARAEAATPEAQCADAGTYEAIRQELFRQAAEIRGSDQAIFDRIAASAAVRMDRPVLRSQDSDLGTIGCSGLLTLDLPPGLAVVGGRRSLSAEIGYVLQDAADGSGQVVMLEGADPIIVPLATLARSAAAQPPPEAQVPPGMEDEEGEIVAPPAPEGLEPPQAPEPPAPPPAASADPSFNCRQARTRSEIAVCNDNGLAALDRQMAAQFDRAMANATPSQRQNLSSSRDRFLRFRDGCRSNDCIADVYRGRMREIGDIMTGRWQPPR